MSTVSSVSVDSSFSYDDSFLLSHSMSESSSCDSELSEASRPHLATLSTFCWKPRPLPASRRHPAKDLRHWESLSPALQGPIIRFLNYACSQRFAAGALVLPVRKTIQLAELQDAVRFLCAPERLRKSPSELDSFLGLQRHDTSGRLNRLGFLHAFADELLDILQIVGFPTAAFLSSPSLFDAAAAPLLPPIISPSESSGTPASTLEELLQNEAELDSDSEGLPLACSMYPPALLSSPHKRRLQS